ncbi:MAG: OmpA family protein [Chitinophagaceae bacterium]|nr:OmpA family protein [Chitinophagaceae bacterium]
MRKRSISLVGCLLLILGPVFAQDEAPAKTYDKRWFISPLLKFQVQDFGMLEKNKLNQASDAEELSFSERSNYTFAASVYKNFTGRLSMSADVGFGKGHVTSKDVLISTTKSKSYNIVNATLFYHLLNSSYRLQPFVSAGISNLTGDQSYTSAPVGAGVKFSARKIMVEAHAAYGYGVSKNVANALIYNVGIYIPLKSRKDKEKKKEEDKKAADKKDTAKGGNVTYITNNYYFLMGDSTKNKVDEEKDSKAEQEARDKARADLNPGADKNNAGGTEGNTDAGGNPKGTGEGENDVNKDNTTAPLDPDDPMNLPAAEKSIVYFYYDSYSLSSSAFTVVDQVIQRMKEDKTLNVHLKGYTDLAGSEQYNLPLSKKRAQMVLDYMNSRGITADRIILSHYGKENPVIDSVDPKSAWQNRRCEIVLFEKK